MKVLVVDDSMLILKIVDDYLKAFPEISEIVLCDKPENVQNILDNKSIDIILLDLVMPKISGFDILRMINNQSKYKHIKVIILTSLKDNDSFKLGFELGAHDYINKPINIIEFNARIKVATQLVKSTKETNDLIEYTQEKNKELKRTNKILQETKVHLAQSDKMAAIGQMAAGIAHEINNPMGFVCNNCEVLSKYFMKLSEYIKKVDESLSELDNDKEAAGRIAEEIRNVHRKEKIALIQDEIPGLLDESKTGIQRVTEIVSAMRSFAREVDDDEKESYSLLNIVKQVLLITNNEVKYVSEIVLNVPEDLVVYCNRLKLGQVLINIIVNAAQAIKSQERSKKGCITISADNEGAYINIYVTDDGPGIPQKNLNKIFDPFFTTKEAGQGTGLGLSISYDIITTSHGGMLLVNSEVGIGTTFTIKLPNITERIE